MSLADMNEALDEHMLGDEPEVGESTGFTIDDLTKADWAVRKIAQARRRLANALEVAQANRARIDEFIDAEKHRCETSTEFLLDQLERFHRAVLDDDPKAKTVRVPAGELQARKAPDTIDVVDVGAFVAWARHNRPELLRIKTEPDKPELKRRLRASDSDEQRSPMVDIETGEPVPGIASIAGQTTFTVKTEADR